MSSYKLHKLGNCRKNCYYCQQVPNPVFKVKKSLKLDLAMTIINLMLPKK